MLLIRLEPSCCVISIYVVSSVSFLLWLFFLILYTVRLYTYPIPALFPEAHFTTVMKVLFIISSSRASTAASITGDCVPNTLRST